MLSTPLFCYVQYHILAVFSIPLQAILAAVVIANLIGLLKQFSRLRVLWKIHKPDSVRWVSSFSLVRLSKYKANES